MAYNRLFNPATWDDVNSENKELLDDYILELKSNGKSEKTIYQYVADIKGRAYEMGETHEDFVDRFMNSEVKE